MFLVLHSPVSYVPGIIHPAFQTHQLASATTDNASADTTENFILTDYCSRNDRQRGKQQLSYLRKRKTRYLDVPCFSSISSHRGA
jgi:hypothetical protein